jgi:hypothetical protein
MRQEDLDLEVRIAVAQQALPFAHSRPKVNDKIGPRVKVVKVNSDADSDNVTPLDFLLGVMKDADTPPTLRLRVAGIVAPYVHRKGEPNRADEAPTEMRVVDDPYGFDADLVDKVASIDHDQEQLDATMPFPARRALYEVRTGKKIPKTAVQLELESRIAEKQAALKCPSSYKELDSRQDRARLRDLDAESKIRSLTAAEEIEQRHLQARLEVYSWTPEAADCKQMNFLKALSREARTPEQKEELARLEARYRGVPLDLTCIERSRHQYAELRYAEIRGRERLRAAEAEKRPSGQF